MCKGTWKNGDSMKTIGFTGARKTANCPTNWTLLSQKKRSQKPIVVVCDCVNRPPDPHENPFVKRQLVNLKFEAKKQTSLTCTWWLQHERHLLVLGDHAELFRHFCPDIFLLFSQVFSSSFLSISWWCRSPRSVAAGDVKSRLKFDVFRG